jgi:purine-binding chemotaxis protein CheW
VLALALVADRVIEVVSFSSNDIDLAPDIGTPWRSDYIRGVVRREADFVVLFDLPRLLSSASAVLASAENAEAA